MKYYILISLLAALFSQPFYVDLFLVQDVGYSFFRGMTLELCAESCTPLLSVAIQLYPCTFSYSSILIHVFKH